MSCALFLYHCACALYYALAVFDSVCLQEHTCVFISMHVLIMPPTSKKLEGRITSGTFVRASVHPSVTLFDVKQKHNF